MISVIVPVYNTEQYVGRCIESVLDSVYEKFELILINDGSTDLSLLICNRYSEKDRRVKVINQKHMGVSAARNIGIKESQGEWIVFVDSDDRISSDFLGIVARKDFEKNDLILCDFDSHAEYRKKYIATVHSLGPYHYKSADRAELIRHLLDMRQLVKGGNTSLCSPCAKAYRKSVIDQYTIQFPEDIVICEDRIFNMEYLVRIRSCIYIQKPVYHVSKRPDSAMHTFHTDFLQNDIKYQIQLVSILRRENLLPLTEREYCSSVLSNMADVLIRGIFHPHSGRTYDENVRLCEQMQENSNYQNAMRYAGRTGRLPRKILLFFYKVKCYKLVDRLCRVSRLILNL